jgi:hypothetical protein
MMDGGHCVDCSQLRQTIWSVGGVMGGACPSHCPGISQYNYYINNNSRTVLTSSTVALRLPFDEDGVG